MKNLKKQLEDVEKVTQPTTETIIPFIRKNSISSFSLCVLHTTPSGKTETKEIKEFYHFALAKSALETFYTNMFIKDGLTLEEILTRSGFIKGRAL